MADERMTRWLSSIYDEGSEGEVLEKRLIIIQEKEFSIQQQKIIINENNKSKDQKQQIVPKDVHITTVKNQSDCLVQMV